MSGRRMLRHEIFVDGGPQTVSLQDGPVRHVAASRGGGGRQVVEFWVESDAKSLARGRVFEVFGTGHPLPGNAVWRGTTDRTPEGLAWHLYELTKDV